MMRMVLISMCLASVVSAGPLDGLLDSNPVGHRTLSAIDYIRYAPTEEILSGTFEPAFSGTSAPFVERVREHLATIHPGVDWTTHEKFTSSPGVLWYLLNGKADIGISSWPMTSAEREEFVRRFGYPLLEARVALDALQVVVHRDNTLPSITVPQLDAIFGTELRAGATEVIRDWGDLGGTTSGEIHPYCGSLHYGTSLFFQRAVLEDGPWSDAVRTTGDATDGPEERIAGDPLGIGFCNFAPRGDSIRVLPVARQTAERAVLPLPEHIYGEEYPLVRFFYVYVNARSVAEIPPVQREFLRYLLSFEGQYEVAKASSLPLDIPMIQRARKRLGLD